MLGLKGLVKRLYKHAVYKPLDPNRWVVVRLKPYYYSGYNSNYRPIKTNARIGADTLVKFFKHTMKLVDKKYVFNVHRYPGWKWKLDKVHVKPTPDGRQKVKLYLRYYKDKSRSVKGRNLNLSLERVRLTISEGFAAYLGAGKPVAIKDGVYIGVRAKDVKVRQSIKQTTRS